MDVSLKILEGSKAGGKISVKKSEFVIGRSQECHLCAASSAISRKHCAIYRQDAKVTVKDLGSRNGTLINGKKIDAEVELNSGDELSVGPLKFLVTITAGISNGKRPEVKTVAEAVARVAEKAPGEVRDDDISQWLLGAGASSSETQTIRMDETGAAQLLAAAQAAENGDTKAMESDPKAEEDAEGNKKSGPGKLPKLPPKPSSKDSREAAAEALRAWSRRR